MFPHHALVIQVRIIAENSNISGHLVKHAWQAVCYQNNRKFMWAFLSVLLLNGVIFINIYSLILWIHADKRKLWHKINMSGSSLFSYCYFYNLLQCRVKLTISAMITLEFDGKRLKNTKSILWLMCIPNFLFFFASFCLVEWGLNKCQMNPTDNIARCVFLNIFSVPIHSKNDLSLWFLWCYSLSLVSLKGDVVRILGIVIIFNPRVLDEIFKLVFSWEQRSQ